MARKPETDKQPKQSKKPADAREARLAAALRENLRRRKVQERQRATSAEPNSAHSGESGNPGRKD